MPSLPLVSVCIPAYDVEGYITETIESVLNQTYKSIEIIIVDDGSTDNTREVAEQFKTVGIQVYHQNNKGAAAARNLAYTKSTGDYIKFLDGDDLINPGMIESQVNCALENENCIVSSGWGRFYNNDLDTFKLNPEECWQTLAPEKWLSASWKNGNSMTQPGIFLIPRRIIEKAGLWNESLSLIDDMDFFTRTILNCKEVIYAPDAILYYRSGVADSLSAQKSGTAILSAFNAIDVSTKNLLAYNSSPEILNACANTWQQFIYDVYPAHSQYTSYAEKQIKQLNGSTLKFPCGGFTKILVSAIGWKLTKKLKKLFAA